MPTKTVDILIIGGGIVGLSLAHALGVRRAGKIVVLERNLPASGSTGRSVASLLPMSPFQTIARLYKQSYDTFAQFGQAVGGDVGFVRLPMAILAGEQDVSALQEVITIQQKAGIDLKMIMPDAFAALEPSVTLDGVTAVGYSPDAGYVDPTQAAWSYGGAAQALGVDIVAGLPDSQVVDIVHDGHQVTGVQTAGDTQYKAKVIALATGAWTPYWLQKLRLSVPLHVVRHGAGTIKTPDGATRPQHLIVDRSANFYARPDGNTLTTFGGLDQRAQLPVDDVETEPPTPTTSELAAPRYGLNARFPSMAGAMLTRSWSGWIDQTPDGCPLIGVLPIDGLYLAAGLGGFGLALAPAIGQVMAGMMLDDSTAIEQLVQLRYARFDDGMALQAKFSFNNTN
jgi:sarcosine oxidase, subunit beta